MAGDPRPTPVLLVAGFPTPGVRVQKAYQDLWTAQNGTDVQKQNLGNPAKLAHPWEPGTCTDPSLRWDLWCWLDEVATWINSQYVWEASSAGHIPPCWPHHPHLIHELAVLADQRRRASLALTSDNLENWHRYVLPGFLDRMKNRLKQTCDDDHQPWPARSRHTRHTSQAAQQQRLDTFTTDRQALEPPEPPAPTRPRLTVVDGHTIDPITGEITD